MANALALPWPYVPGEQAPDSFEDRVQQNMDALAIAVGGQLGAGQALQLAVPGTARKVAFGTGTATFTASATSAAVNVAHGLGVVPTAVLLTGVGGAAWPVMQVNSVDATNISVTCHDSGGTSRTGTNQFYWLAIG